ncbi:hypothetical protein PROFUN_04005 [Planoprotostelium fungivorum]|uniref:Mitochondrial carrier protein n=1 Tax=Planoprotostelium fungivorum TaxID=1890364 RepID=A0A2P6NW41_9EUKA|nr:hypothetical protein PROFUN_04005 [Planoprotostelium fungivorum]
MAPISQDGLFAFLAGAVYGGVSLIVGHPLDTLKTKMQAQDAHLKGSSIKVFSETLKKEGIVGLYRGCIPPLLGASLLRSAQFGFFTSTYRLLQPKPVEPGQTPGFWERGLPSYQIYGPVNTNLILAGMAGGAGRSVIESPLDLAKIRRQIGQSWKFRECLHGMNASLARNVPLLTFFFLFIEISKGIDISPQWRPFLTGSICSTLAWTIIWPFDVIKSQVQGGSRGTSMWQKAKMHYRNQGWYGFFRGYGPGAARSLLANGASMVAYVKTEKYLKEKYGSQSS